MTKSEFQKKVIELLKRYDLTNKMQEKILPLFSIVDNLNQDEMMNVYNILEEAIVAQKQTEELALKLKVLYSDFNKTIKSFSKRIIEIRKRLEWVKNNSDLLETRGLPSKQEFTKIRNETAMTYNKHSFSGEKPNFGLKLNKLFGAYITEYGPEHITMVISDSILYTNNLILRIFLKTKNVLIGSSKSLKLYETSEGHNYLVTDKPEVIPYGNRRGFYFKNITYEDILNLTNGDFFKVFTQEILDAYKGEETSLPEELKNVGYFKFE
jgi:hypothetical protein